MRKAKYIPAVVIAGGVVGLFLRVLYLRKGFEPDTGLPILGSPYSLPIWIWCVVVALALFFLSGGKHERFPKRYTAAFTPQSGLHRVLLLGSVFLLVVAGFLNISAYFTAASDALGQRSVGFPRVILGCLCMLAAWSIFFVLKEMLEGREADKYLISFPGILACFWVISKYQDWARDPLIDRYSLELFAVVIIMIAIVFAAGFGFGNGKVSGALFFIGEGAAFGFMLLGDGQALYDLSLDLALVFYLLGLCFALTANDGIPQPPAAPEGGSPCSTCPSAAAPGGCTACPSAPPEQAPDNNDAP